VRLDDGHAPAGWGAKPWIARGEPRDAATNAMNAISIKMPVHSRLK
jgi:hypothetical protein